MIDISSKCLISFTDLFHQIKEHRKKIFLIFLIMSFLYFSYSLFKPISYTAEGLFKTPPPKTSVWLDFLTKDEKEASTDDNPKLLLNSYPITSLVVKKLHLQGYIECGRKSFFLNRIWQNLYLERSFSAMGSHEHPPSEILPKKILVPRTSLNFLSPSSLYFTDLVYEGDTHAFFFMRFLDDENFVILNAKKEKMGTGKLNEPFHLKHGHFTLSGKPSKKWGKIHFIPLSSAAYGLGQSLNIKKDKKQPALLHVSYTSPNVELAVNIVNETMECYQQHIREHAAQKVHNQVLYLKERQKMGLVELEQMMQEQKQSRKDHIHEGGYMQLEKEAAFLMAKKSEITETLLELKIQIEHVASNVFKKAPVALRQETFESLLNTIRTLEMGQWHLLPLHTLKELISEHLKLVDQWELEKTHYEYCLRRLHDPTADVEALGKILQEPSLRSHIEAIQTLYARLHDDKNWSQREKEIFQSELVIKKELFQKELSSLKEARFMQLSVFKQRLETMYQAYLVKLSQEYEKMEEVLADLTQKELSFPEKWMKEETLSLHTKMTQGMIEQISKAMEIKNISAQVTSSESYPFRKAFYPILPHPPYIILGSLITGIFAVLGYIFYLFLRHSRLGPTASLKNLRLLKLFVMGEASLHPGSTYSDCDEIDQKCLKALSCHLLAFPIVMLSCQKPTSFWIPLFQLMTKRQESMALVHFEQKMIPGFDNYTFASDSIYLEECLSSKPFSLFLKDLKTRYDRIFLIHTGKMPTIYPPDVSCRVLFVTSEMLYDLPRAVYVTERNVFKKEKEVYLQEIRPLIDAVQARVHSLKEKLKAT